MFNDKSILITGGTGSFGRRYVKTILARFKPKRLVVYSRDELKQYEMQQEVSSTALRYFIGDVRDGERLRQAMRGIDFVIHAAALKQAPAAEYNPMECIKTNVHGAENVIAAALDNDVEKVIALSTDKAASPVNLYGATKLVSDKLFVAANNMTGKHRTRFSVVRYGNVVGSRGSVVPYFQKLIDRGERELPVTDPRMTRFWITLDQGVAFVLAGFERMRGGEIFIPKIPSVRILDLVEAMRPGTKARFIGVRPGEKIHEVMVTADDAVKTLEFDDHYVIQPAIVFITPVDYRSNARGEAGRPVPEGFEYNSGTNPLFLTPGQIRTLHGGVA